MRHSTPGKMSALTAGLLLVGAWSAAAWPVAQRVVDLTHGFDKSTLHWPTSKDFDLQVVVNGTIGSGIWVLAEEYVSSTHSGTHMDAPSHFVLGGADIDQLPAAALIAPAAIVDITAQSDADPDYAASTADLERWEAATGRSLNGTVLLLRTGWSRRWGDPLAFYGNLERDYRRFHFPGLGEEACDWLAANRTLAGVGTEALSFDVGTSVTFPCHSSLLAQGMYGLENVANMDKLPLYGATLYAMPMKIAGASGAPVRILASYPDVVFAK